MARRSADDQRADEALQELDHLDRQEKAQAKGVLIAEWAAQTIAYLREVRYRGQAKAGFDPAHYKPDGCPVVELMEAIGFQRKDWPAIRDVIDATPGFILGSSPHSKGYYAGLDGDQADRVVHQARVIRGSAAGANRTLTALDNTGQIDAVRRRLATVQVDKDLVARLIGVISLIDGPVLEQIGRALLTPPGETT